MQLNGQPFSGQIKWGPLDLVIGDGKPLDLPATPSYADLTDPDLDGYLQELQRLLDDATREMRRRRAPGTAQPGGSAAPS